MSDLRYLNISSPFDNKLMGVREKVISESLVGEGLPEYDFEPEVRMKRLVRNVTVRRKSILSRGNSKGRGKKVVSEEQRGQCG